MAEKTYEEVYVERHEAMQRGEEYEYKPDDASGRLCGFSPFQLL